MTFTANFDRTATRPGPRDWIGRRIAALRAARARRAEYNQIRGELSAMTDRDLADIGISRHSIDDIARVHVTR